MNREGHRADGRGKALEGYLVACARAGDRAALARLAKLRGPRMLTHAARLLGERDGAHDIVQEAWIEIIRGIGSLREDGAFLPWALRIVTRRVAREIERRQRGRRLAEGLAAIPDEPHRDEAALEIDGRRVAGALSTLSPAHSATMALFYLEEMSVSDVAEALDVPVGTVKTRLMHARKALRAQLEGDEEYGQA